MSQQSDKKPTTSDQLQTALQEMLELLSDDRLQLADAAPQELIAWLKDVQKKEKECLLLALVHGVPEWFPFETMNPSDMPWEGFAEATYLVFRGLLMREQCQGLLNKKLYVPRVTEKQSLNRLNWASSFLTRLVQGYLDEAEHKNTEHLIRIALANRWAKWFDDLMPSGPQENARFQFREALNKLVDCRPGESALSLGSLATILQYGRGIGCMKGRLSWNVVPCRWLSREKAKTDKIDRAKALGWPDVQTGKGKAPLGLLGEVVFYPFIETPAALRQKLGACYSAKNPISPDAIKDEEIDRMFFRSNEDKEAHFRLIRGDRMGIVASLKQLVGVPIAQEALL